MKRMILIICVMLLIVIGITWAHVEKPYEFKPWNEGIWFLRTDSQGDTLWTQVYGEGDMYPYWPTFARETSDGGYIITGGFSDDRIHDFYGKKFWLIKIDDTGWMEWCKIYDIPLNDSLLDLWNLPAYVSETPKNGYIIESSWRLPLDQDPVQPLWFVEVDSQGSVVSFNDKSTLTAPLTKGCPFFLKYNPSAKVEYPDAYFSRFRRSFSIYIIEEDAIVEVEDSCIQMTGDYQRCTMISLIKRRPGDKPIWSKDYILGEPIHNHFVGLTSDNGFIILATISFPSD